MFHALSPEMTNDSRSLCGLPMNVLQDYLVDPFRDDMLEDDMTYEPAPAALMGDYSLDGFDSLIEPSPTSALRQASTGSTSTFETLAPPPPPSPQPKNVPPSVLAAVVKTEGISAGGVGEPGAMIKKVYEPPPLEEHLAVAASSSSRMPPLLGSVPPAPSEPAPTTSTTTATSASAHNKRVKLEPPIKESGASSPAPAVEEARPVQHRPKTQAQIDRRRDRNRILARRTRLRKKFFFESLQHQVAELERENAMLKEIMRTHPALANEARAIQSQCAASTTGQPASSVLTETRSRATELLTPTDFALMRLLQSAQRSFCITDPSLEDNPIVYASQSFLSQTGYALDQVVGRNCRFLQGPLTDRATVDRLRHAVSRGEDVSVTLLNYRADGTTFWNQLFIASLRDINERVVNYVGVQTEVPGPTPPPDAQASGGGIQHPAEQLPTKLSGKYPPSRVIVPASPFSGRIGGPSASSASAQVAENHEDDDDAAVIAKSSPGAVPKDHPAASLLASPVFNQKAQPK